MKDNQTLLAGESTRPPLISGTNPPHHILVVEDDRSIRQLNIEVLSRAGYEVDAAEDGAAAWVELGADSYDLMITDNHMPRLSGVELLAKLHAARLDLPVIMATGKLPAEEFSRHPWLQPAAMLLKPYTIAELLHTVQKVLREAESTPADFQLALGRDRTNNETSPAGGPTGNPPPTPEQATHRILVVDEDRDLRQLYAEALAGPGYAVDGAEDGAAGWEALQAKPYNLLITEHELPKLTGVELVRRLRAAHMALPVVMASGRLPADELARNPSLLLAATLTKPFAVDALLDTVNHVLQPPAPRELIGPRPSWPSQPSAISLRPA